MLREFSQTRTRVPRTPFYRAISRALLSALLIFTALPGTVRAASSALTEREAVNRALSRTAWVEAETARVALAESVVAEAGLMPNPVLDFSRDRLAMPGGDITERSVQISQTFDFSGRRSLRREAAARRLDAEKFDGRIRRLNTIAEVRRTFAEALHYTQIQDALGLRLTRIEQVSRVTAKLTEAGEASGYDRRRLEREAHTARARLTVAQADAVRSREKLAALTGNKPDVTLHLQGNLLPDAAPALVLLQTGLRQRPDLASLLVQAEALAGEQQAAQRGWIPDLTVGIGQKTLDETTRRGSGAIVGISFSIPLLDHGQVAQQRSHAQEQTVRAEHALALSKADADLRGAWQQAEELRKAALTYHRDASDDSRNLSHIAEAAYRAGEAGLLELLDAYRSELDFVTSELDLALHARLARIELETLSGVSSYE